MPYTSFYIIASILLALKAISLVLLLKHINLLEKSNKNQVLLHEDLLKIQVELIKIKGQGILRGFEDKNSIKQTPSNNEITELKSSKMSKEELAKLVEGKELISTKQVHGSPGEMFIDTDTDINI